MSWDLDAVIKSYAEFKENADTEKPFAVVLTTGSLNPPHFG